MILVFNKSYLGSGYLNLGDIAFPFLPRKALFDTFYPWAYSNNFGAYNTVNLLPYYTFIFLMSSLQIPPMVVNRLAFAIPLLLVGFSAVYLGKVLFGTKFSSVACAVSSVFLLVSPALSFLTDPKFMFAFGGMILFLGFFIRGFRYGQHRKYAFLAALSTILMSIALHVFALSAILIFTFLVVYFFLCGSRLKKIPFVAGTLLLSILFNLYWIIPVSLTSLANPDVLQTVYRESTPKPYGVPCTSLFWRLRLLFFSNPLTELPTVIVVEFAVIVFGLSYLVVELFRRRLPKIESIPFFVSFFIFLTLYQGVSSPLYMFLWDNFSMFHVLRNSSYFVLPICLVFSVLIGFSSEALLQLIDGWKSKLTATCISGKRAFIARLRAYTRKKSTVISAAILLALFFSVIAAYGIPCSLLFRGPIDHSLEHRSDMDIPSEYFQLPSLLDNSSDSQFRLLVLPWQHSANINFTWFSHFLTPDITERFSPIPTVVGGMLPYIPPKVQEILEALDVDADAAAERIGHAGIKYVLLHHDENGVEQTEERLRKTLDSSPHFFLMARYGSFSLYRLDDRYLLPKIYAIEYPTVLSRTKVLSFGDGYFLSANISSLALVPPFSISLWVDEVEGTGGVPILRSSSTQYPPGSTYDFGPAFQFFTDNAGQPGFSQFFVASPNGSWFVSKYLTLGSFHHLVGVVLDSSIAYYVDGLLVGNTTTLGSSAKYEGNPAVYIGSYPQMGIFHGFVHNVQFYKSALSYPQVSNLFQRGIIGGPLEEAIPILHWPLNSTVEEMSNDSLEEGRWFGTVDVYNLTDYLEERFWPYKLKPVTYDALSPVSFSGTLGPGNQILIFNEQFDNLWELRVGTNVVKDHWIYDEFANAWSFKNEKNISFSIRLIHYDAALLSLFVSIGSIGLMFLVLWVFPVFLCRISKNRLLNNWSGKDIAKSLFHLIRNKINIRNIIVALTITIASLLVYGDLMFKPNTFIIWSDAPFEFFADEVSQKLFNGWDFENFGFPFFFHGIVSYLGPEGFLLTYLPPWVVNRVLCLLPPLLRGISMYYLLSSVIRKDDSISTFSKILPSIFFVAIPFDVYVFPNTGLHLAFMSLIIAFFIRGTLTEHSTLYVWLGALSSVILFSSPVLTGLTFIILFFYLISIIVESRNRISLLFYSLKFLLLVGLFNMVTLVPAVYTYLSHESLTRYLGVVGGALSEAHLAAGAHATRLFWISRMIVGGQASAPYFSLPVVALLSFFMVAYCYASVFLISSNEKRVRIFARWLIISALCLTLLATGVAYPISGSVYLFLYRTIPGLFYNVSYLLYPLSIIYACMLGFATYLIVRRIASLSPKRSRIEMRFRQIIAASLVGIAVVSVFAYIFPVYSGFGFRGYDTTEIPEDYFQLRDLLKDETVDDYRLFVYPPVDHFVRPTWSDQSTSSGYISPPIIDIVDKFSPVPTIVWRVGLHDLVRDKHGAGELVQRALLDLDRANTHDAVRTLGILSVRYIFVHKDIPGIQYSKVAETLSSSSDVTLIKDSENYMLFEIDKSLLVPMVFAVSATDINASGFILNPTTLIRGHATSSGEYIIPIPEGKEVIVVLNQAYSSDWKLSGGQLKSTRMLVNGFANGWQVESTEEIVGLVTLTSNFWISLGATLSTINVIAFSTLVCINVFHISVRAQIQKRLVALWRHRSSCESE